MMEIQREVSAYALPLQGIVHLEVSHVSGDDHFAALLDCWGWSLAAGDSTLAVGGWHPCRSARQAAPNDADIMANFPREWQNK